MGEEVKVERFPGLTSPQGRAMDISCQPGQGMLKPIAFGRGVMCAICRTSPGTASAMPWSGRIRETLVNGMPELRKSFTLAVKIVLKEPGLIQFRRI